MKEEKKVSKKTKQKAENIASFTEKTAKKLSIEQINGVMDRATEILGKIYNLIVDTRIQEVKNHELKIQNIENDDLLRTRRNDEIIKALSVKFKPIKKVFKEAKKPKKKTEEAPPAPTSEPGKPPSKAPEGKAPSKAAEPVKASEVKPEVKPTPKPEVKPEVKPTPKPEVKPEVKPTPKPEVKPTAEPVKAPEIGKVTETVKPELGKLSSKFETGGRKNSAGIVGWDKKGGTSYGTYQIAAGVGSMAAFLKFAEAKGETDIVSRLKASGPADTGGKTGPFVDEWKKIASEKGESFEQLQHDFIEETQYKPAVASLLKETKYDIQKQSSAIKDVFFSTVVQHGSGGAKSIFKTAIKESGGNDADPEKIISNVYKLRSTKFSGQAVEESVKKRFIQEEQLALEMQRKPNEQKNLTPDNSKVQPSTESKPIPKSAESVPSASPKSAEPIKAPDILSNKSVDSNKKSESGTSGLTNNIPQSAQSTPKSSTPTTPTPQESSTVKPKILSNIPSDVVMTGSDGILISEATKQPVRTGSASIESVVPNKGEKINASSQQNKELKKEIFDSNSSPVTIINNTTQQKANPPSSSSPPPEVKESDDEAIYYIKQKKGKL